MENKKKNNTALIVVIVLLCIFLFFALIGFGGYYAYKNIIEPKISDTVKEGKNTTTTTPSTTNNSKKSSTSSSSKDAKVADKTAPVKVGQWALASKYAGKYLDESYAEQTYIDVPVRVTKISRGNSLSNEVKDLLASKHYKANDPKKTLEWAIVEYEVDLSDVKFGGSLGTTIKIDSGIKGTDGGSVKYNDITYIGLSTIDVSSSDYVKEPGVYSGKFVTQLPEGCSDYLIKLGNSYNGSESYFKGE